MSEVHDLIDRVRAAKTVKDGVATLLAGLREMLGERAHDPIPEEARNGVMQMHDDLNAHADALVNAVTDGVQYIPGTREPIPGTTGVSPALAPGIPTGNTPPIASDTSAATVMPMSAPIRDDTAA